MKAFQTPQRSVNITIQVFSLHLRSRRERLSLLVKIDKFFSFFGWCVERKEAALTHF